jgi:hypothetical protein
MMRSSAKRIFLLLCYGYLALAVVPAWSQTKPASPTITVYKTPT